MSQSAEPAASRPTNEKDSVNAAPADNPASDGDRDLPTPREAAEKACDVLADRTALPMASPGSRLRRRYVNEQTETWQSDPPDGRDWETVTGTEVTRIDAVSVGEAIYRCLSDHEDTRQSRLVLERHPPEADEPEQYRPSPQDRWSSGYQQRYFAELKAITREFTGGERPSGERTSATFERPAAALLGLTASAAPDGSLMPPADHARAVLGTRERRYHALRNLMRSAGLELGEDWVYLRQAEPHDGKRAGDGHGTNLGYTHDHTVVLFDAAEADLEESDFAPVLEAHVDNCGPAEREAHKPGEAVEVRRAEALEDPAAYLAGYLSVAPDDLLERPPEYQMWAAVMTATNQKVRTKSNAAKAAVRADRCKQQYESPKADQSHDHGERVRREVHRGSPRLVCAECGSPHGVDDNHDTLTGARLSASSDGPRAAADGGAERPVIRRRDGRERRLAETWRDAETVVSVGESVATAEARAALATAGVEAAEADPAVLAEAGKVLESHDVEADLEAVEAAIERDGPPPPVVVDRPPEWELVAVEVGESEYPASAGTGVEMVETTPDPVEVMAEGEWFEAGKRYRCNCGVCAYGRDYLAHLLTHGLEDPARAAVVTRRETPEGETWPADARYDPAA